MDTELFVERIRESVRNSTVKEIETELLKSPDRHTPKGLVALHNWYLTLPAEDRPHVRNLVEHAIHSVTFHFLAVLDGVKTLEGEGEKGDFELYFVKHGKSVRINDPDKEFLHDLFNQEMPEALK